MANMTTESETVDGDPSLALIDTATMRGLEIGPLANPRVRKPLPVFYLDHASTEELRVKYSENKTLAPQIDDLVEVDFVQRGGDSLIDLVGGVAPFDYVIASHVIEHIPNPIGWIKEIAAILRPNGILSLVVPDKRFTFDVNRTPTDTSTWVDAYLRELRKPSFQQMYDLFSRVTTIDGMVDAEGLWDGTISYEGVVRSDVPNPSVAALHVCMAHRNNPELPIDIHCQVFTPLSFLRIISELMTIGLIDFEIGTFLTTQRPQIEFNVSLRKVEQSGSSDVLRERLLATIPELHETSRYPFHSAADAEFTISARERRLIEAKRRLMESVRSWIPAARRA
jgi:SAM-dependent methyltransferase